jgi:2-dehydropantoate 2-reductase
MRIAVVGAGGVGGVFGGLLARSGQDVAFLARGRTLAALRERGLRVSIPPAPFEVRPVASDDPSRIGPVDAVLVAVKSWQVREVAPSLRPLVGPGTVVVPLQNGVTAADELAAVLGDAPVVGGLCYVFAWQEEPGGVRSTGTPLEIKMGERRGGPSPRLAPLAGALRAAGIEAQVSEDVAVASWEKLLAIETFGAVGAVTRAPIGAIRAVAETRELLLAALEEVDALARARGVRMPPDAVARTLARLDGLPGESTASMQRDIQAGRRSELDEQTGAVVALAGAAGVPVPVHRFLLAALLPQERQARGAAAAKEAG